MSRSLCESRGVPCHLLDAAANRGINWAGILQTVEQVGLPIAIEILTNLLAPPAGPPPVLVRQPFPTPSLNGIAGVILLLACLCLTSAACASEPPRYRAEADTPAYCPPSDTAAKTLPDWEYTSRAVRSGAELVVRGPSVRVGVPRVGCASGLCPVISAPVSAPQYTYQPSYSVAAPVTICGPNGCSVAPSVPQATVAAPMIVCGPNGCGVVASVPQVTVAAPVTYYSATVAYPVLPSYSVTEVAAAPVTTPTLGLGITGPFARLLGLRRTLFFGIVRLR